MASEDVQTNLRLPADLKDQLQSSAAENNRSLSAEVASRLAASFTFPEAFVTREELVSSLREANLRLEADHLVMWTVRTMLANNVVRLFELVPPEQRNESLANAYEFARALCRPEGDGLEEAVAKIMELETDHESPRMLAKAIRQQTKNFAKVATNSTVMVKKGQSSKA